MAKGKYQKLYEARMKRLGKDKSTEDDLQSQVNNLKARLEAGGVENPEADDRNALEKWLNLEQDQGIIGDVLELLERPFQAIKTGITSAQEGDSALKGAWEGLSGQKDTEFKEVLMNTGGFEDEKGKLDLVDVLGYAGDVFLDPVNYIPVAGWGKAAKVLDSTGDIMKAYKATSTLDDLVFKAGGKAIKGGAKIADTGIEKGLKYLDETKGVKAYDKHGNILSENAKLLYGNADAKRASELMPQLAKGQSFAGKVAKPAQGRLETYKKLKNDFTDIFKKSQASINAVIAGRNAETTANTVKTKISKIAKQNEDKVANYAAGVGKTADEVAEDVTLFVESMMDRNISKDDLLKVARKGNLAANDNVLNALETMKSQLPEKLQKGLDLSVTVKPNGYIQLGSGWNKQVLAENGVPSFNELDEANKMINYGNWYTDEDLAKIEELKNDQDFRQLVNELVGEVKDGDVVKFDGDSVKILDGVEAQKKHSELVADRIRKNKLSPDEDTAIHTNYVGNHFYSTVNDTLNEEEHMKKIFPTLPDSIKEKYTKTVEALDKGISTYKTSEDLGLIRADKAIFVRKAFGLPEVATIGEYYDKLSPDFLKRTADELQDKIGKKFTLSKGYHSTSVGRGESFFTDKDMLMEIRAQSGTNVFVTNPSEREAILKRGQEYILRDAEVKKVPLKTARGDIVEEEKLVIKVDIINKDGEVIATIGNDLVNNANKMLDEAFGTNLNSKYINNSGYLPHTIADENMFREANETGAPILKGKTSALKERTRLGSMRENNRLYEKALTGEGATKTTKAFFKKYPKLFEENFNKAFTNKYYNDLTNLGKQNKIINDVLIEQTFGSRKEIENLQKKIKKYALSGDKEKLAEVTSKYNKLTENSTIKYLTKYDSKVPNGFTRITPEHAKDISKKLKKIQNTMGVSDEKFNDLIKLFSNKDGSIAINNDVLRMLEFTVDEKGKNGILKMYDKWLGFFKSTKTLSVTNVMNNLVGNTHNLYLSGINMIDQARLFPKAIEAVKNGPQLYTRKISGEVLTGKESEIANLWEIFVKTGFGGDEIALDMQDLPDFMKDIVLNGKTNKKFTAKDIATFLPKLNMKTNVFMDNTSRFVVMLKAMEDPSYLSKLGIEGATDIEKYQKVISKVMFDPAMMTDVEKNVLKRIIPFYTYTKNNLVFQVDNLGRNGSRYARTMKAIKNLQKGATGDNEEYMADYIKNSLYIPIPGLDENGNYTVLRTTLPFGQLIEMTDNPIKELAGMSGPLFKSAYEYGTGIDTFTGREIESFPGEKSKQLPFMTKKTQKILGDLTGLDVPLKTGYNLITDPLNTITMQNNVDTDRISKMYDEIDELKNMMKQYEQEGYEFSTMTELKKANKNNTVADINAIFAKYGIDQETYAKRKYGQ